MTWVFDMQSPMAKHRDPIQGEFFSTESISSVADSVVRESIQNSMDAKPKDASRSVLVEFSVITIPRSKAKVFLSDLWPHINACDPKAARLRDAKKVSCLVVEDFGTTGLRGDPAEMYAPSDDSQDPPNEFYYFVRAEGQSSKSGSDRGNWGIGKYTYPMVSQINSMFAYTVRGPRCGPGGKGPMAIGLSVLRNHQVGVKRYQPDGWWASFEELEGEPGPCPLPFGSEDLERLDLIAETFELQRGSKPGLSIIVPYVDEELTTDEIKISVIKNFGLAIGWGHLNVTVRETDGDVKISAASLDSTIDSLPAIDQGGIRRDLELARWGAGLTGSQVIRLGRVADRPEWSDDNLMSEAVATDITSRLTKEGRVAVRVPVRVAKTAESEDHWGHFDVLLASSEGSRTAPTFYREGLLISEAGKNTRTPSGIRSIVVIDEAHLAEMLGDAEGPAHVDWSPSTRRFKGKYADGKRWIGFVKKAPTEILKRARSAEEEENRDVAVDFFNTDAPPLDDLPKAPPDDPPGKKGDKGDDKPDPPPELERRGLVIVSELADGFSASVDESVKKGTKIVVRAAYDVRRGQPLPKWEEYDFHLKDLAVAIDGGTHVIAGGNELHLVVTDPKTFDLKVRGFDRGRDLFIKAEVAT